MGGLVAGESIVVIGPGPIGLLGVAVAKSLGAGPVILIGTRDSRLEIGKKLGADYTLNIKNEKDIVQAVKNIVGEKGVDYVVECAGKEKALNDAINPAVPGLLQRLLQWSHRRKSFEDLTS